MYAIPFLAKENFTYTAILQSRVRQTRGVPVPITADAKPTTAWNPFRTDGASPIDVKQELLHLVTT